MSLRQKETAPKKAEVLYLSSDGQIQRMSDSRNPTGKGIDIHCGVLFQQSNDIFKV